MPTVSDTHTGREGRPAAGPTRQAFVATAHCLTGCALGEVFGMVLATWWGWGGVASVLLSVALAVNRALIARGRGHGHRLHR